MKLLCPTSSFLMRICLLALLFLPEIFQAQPHPSLFSKNSKGPRSPQHTQVQKSFDSFIRSSLNLLQNGERAQAESQALNAFLIAYEAKDYIGIYQSLKVLKGLSQTLISYSFLTRRTQLNPESHRKWDFAKYLIETLRNHGRENPISPQNFNEKVLLLVSKAAKQSNRLDFKIFEPLLVETKQATESERIAFWILYFQLSLESEDSPDIESLVLAELDHQLSTESMRNVLILHQTLQKVYLKNGQLLEANRNDKLIQLIHSHQNQTSLDFQLFKRQYDNLKGDSNNLKYWFLAFGGLLLIGAVSALKILKRKRVKPILGTRKSSNLEFENEYLKNLLTPRENEVLEALCEGKTNALIAKELFISQNTVKTHISNIYEKLEVKNRTQAAAKAQSLFANNLTPSKSHL